MAAKKTTPNPAPQNGETKPAVKSSKPVAAAKKPVAKAPKKPASAPKAATLKKTAPIKNAVAEKSVKKDSPRVEESANPVAKEVKASKTETVESVKVDASAKSAAAAKKLLAAKPRSSVVDFPAPPAPVRPPFVPPKAAPLHADGPVTPGSNGSHSVAFVQKQRQRLLDLRDDLVDAVSDMARDTIRNAPEGSEASGSGQHQGDAGSDAYDRDFALSVLAKEQDALYEIEQALRRIQSGAYGICEMSSRKIPQARLEAIPFARLTVECQAQWEKEYGNRRFRPSNEVGFSGGKYVDDDESETVSLDEDDD